MLILPVFELTIFNAIVFLKGFPISKPLKKAVFSVRQNQPNSKTGFLSFVTGRSAKKSPNLR
jgi:hypothetical protein